MSEEKMRMRIKKTAFWYGLLSLVCVIIAAGTLFTMFFDCMVTNTIGEIYWINPFWQDAQDFEQSEVYGQMLHRDVAELSRFLTVRSQLETNGSFDEEKTVDIIPYVYRQKGKVPEKYKDIQLAYKLGDLIEWSQEGFVYVTEEEGDRSYTYESQTGEAALPVGDMPEPEATEWAIEEVTVEATKRADKEVIEETVGEIPQTILQETFRQTDGSSLYDEKLPDGVTYAELENFIQTAATDLYENYDSYQRISKKFSEDSNLKYFMLDENGKLLFSNFTIREDEIGAMQKAFKGSNSYIVYDYAKNQIQCHNIGTYSEIATKSLFHAYSYQFPEGGKLYLTVQDKDAEYFESYHTAGSYAVARSGYDQLAGFGLQNVIAAGVFLILAALFLVVYIVRIPRKEPEGLSGFDRWYTEIAAGIAVFIEVALFLGTTLLADLMIYEPGLPTVGYLRKRECMALLMISAAVLYALFLVFLGSLVRRIKAHTLIRGSLTYTAFAWIKRKIKKIGIFFRNAFLTLLNEKDFGIRVVLPLTCYVLLNIIFVLVLHIFGAFLVIFMHVILLRFLYKENQAGKSIIEGITRICDGDLTYQIDTKKLVGDNKILAENVNQIGNAIEKAVRTSMKDERLKADLITNVSHDIKTPLTSIINYVDLLKRENIQGERAQEYLRILDEKSQRLKQLTLDLVEASKISSGNIVIEKTRLNVEELLQQAIGEYQEKLEERQLTVITSVGAQNVQASPLIISADPRHMWRILDNLLGNICKYALAGTRVYVDALQNEKQQVELVIKNISAGPLSVSSEELQQRFVRGDASRSSEGSGLGLSIARNLTLAQGGSFDIVLDGDLFKVLLGFPRLDGSSGDKMTDDQ